MSPHQPSPDGNASPQVVRFGTFEFNLGLAELRRNGTRLRLQEQPARLLVILVENPGRLVTREELRTRLWSSDTFVEFDASLNTAVRKIRQVLDDSADVPRYIETVPRKGYRFIAPVLPVPAASRPVLVMPRPAPDESSAPAEPVEPRNDSATEPAPIVLQPAASPEPPSVSRRRLITGAVAATAVISAGAAFWYGRSRGSRGLSDDPTGQVAEFTFETPPDLAHPTQFGPTLAISADGSLMCFVLHKPGNPATSLYLRTAGATDFERVPGADHVSGPFLARNADALYYRREGQLIRVERRSGVQRRLASVIASPEIGFEGSDGMVYYSAADPRQLDALTTVWRVPADGSRDPEPLVFDDHPELGALWILPLQLLPDQRRLLVSTFRNPSRTLAVLDLKTRQLKPLAEGVDGGYSLPGGHVVHHRGTFLLGQRLRSDDSQVLGSPVILRRDVASASWCGANMSISDTGTLLYEVRQREIPDRTLVWIDLSGKETPLGFPPGPYEPIEVSPDGESVLMRRFDHDEGLWSLWRMGLKSGEWTELLKRSRSPRDAAWSADGKEIIVQVEGQGLARIPGSGAGERVLLVRNANLGYAPGPVRPGLDFVLVADGFHTVDYNHVLVVPLNGGQPQVILKRHFHPALSPDGRWLATSTTDGICVQPFPVAAGVQPTTIGLGRSPVWSADGRSLYWLAGRRLMAAEFHAGSAVPFSKSRVISEQDFFPPDRWVRRLTFHPGERRFLMARNGQPSPPPRATRIVLNWFSDVRRLYPPA